MGSVGLGGQRWHGSSWQRGIAESGSSRLWTLMIGIPGDLVWDLPYVQQASYLEGGPLMWMLPLYLHFNQKSVDDDDSSRHGSLTVRALHINFFNFPRFCYVVFAWILLRFCGSFILHARGFFRVARGFRAWTDVSTHDAILSPQNFFSAKEDIFCGERWLLSIVLVSTQYE